MEVTNECKNQNCRSSYEKLVFAGIVTGLGILLVIFLGIPVTYLYNMLAGIIRSLGDSKTPVYFLLLSSLMNIGLDFFTILVLGMGVGGPALATVISQEFRQCSV
mgnify:CR=1 FL=1